jgi:hypothetical protein
MKVSLLPKVIITIVVAALLLVPVSLVLLQSNSKKVNAYYEPNDIFNNILYRNGFGQPMDDYIENNSPFQSPAKTKATSKRNSDCQSKYGSNYVFNNWYCDPNSLDFDPPRSTNISPEACSQVYICSENYASGLTDSDCKNIYGSNYKLDNYQCVPFSLNYRQNKTYQSYGNTSMDCLYGYINVGNECVPGSDIYVPKPEQGYYATDDNTIRYWNEIDNGYNFTNPGNEGVSSYSTEEYLFQDSTIYNPFQDVYQDPINNYLPEQNFDFDNGYYNS